MRKLLVALCTIATVTAAFTVPSLAQSDDLSDGERPPADGGYHPCPNDELLAEMGIKFFHTAYPGNPTVFQVIPTDSGRIHIRHLGELFTRLPTKNQVMAYSTGGIIGANVVRLFDTTNNEYREYKEEFTKCLNKHPIWIRYWSSRATIGSSNARLPYITSWESIYLQLACHAIGAVAGEIAEDGYNLINIATGGLADFFTGFFRDRDDDIDINVGNPTWDLEGHRRVEHNIAIWTRWRCNW